MYYKKRHTTGVISNRPNLTISHHLAFALLSIYKPLAKFIVKRTFFVECHWHAVVTKKDCSPLNSSENVTRVVIKYTVTLQQQQPWLPGTHLAQVSISGSVCIVIKRAEIFKSGSIAERILILVRTKEILNLNNIKTIWQKRTNA